MVFLEIIVIGLAIWQLHDVLLPNALEKRVVKYNGYTAKEVLDDPKVGTDFAVTIALMLIGALIEFATLVYLALKKYLFPFSAVTLFLFMMMWFTATIKKKPKNKDGETIINYKPSLLNKVYRKIVGTYVLVFYLVLLYNFFIV